MAHKNNLTTPETNPIFEDGRMVAQITSQEHCSTYTTKVFKSYSLIKAELKVVCCSLISFAVSIWLQKPWTILQQRKLNSLLKLTTTEKMGKVNFKTGSVFTSVSHKLLWCTQACVQCQLLLLLEPVQ